MGRTILIGLAIFLMATLAWAQSDGPEPGSSTILGAANPLLARGADAIRAGDYDDGILFTLEGLAIPASSHDRSAGLSNLCAAYAAKGMADTAIEYCTQSLAINGRNWRAYSNRSYAYWLKRMFSEATFDLDAAAALSPKARQVAQIRGMINLSRFQPRITMEDLQ